MNRLRQVTVRVVIASFLMMVPVMPTLAQIGSEPVEAAPEMGSWKAFVLAIFFAVAVAVGCLMSPKRTHQD